MIFIENIHLSLSKRFCKENSNSRNPGEHAVLQLANKPKTSLSDKLGNEFAQRLVF